MKINQPLLMFSSLLFPLLTGSEIFPITLFSTVTIRVPKIILADSI